jgi:hypothetical protein
MQEFYTSTSMDPSQATITLRSPNTQAHNNNAAPDSVVKDELDDGDFLEESDTDDGGVYKPRPQLPQPNVHMRSLGSLISK